MVNVARRSNSILTSTIDRALDKLVLPGYTSIGYSLRKRWWPTDAPPFAARADGSAVEIVVTGAGSGLGAAATAGLAALGARVHLVGRSAGRLTATADSIRAVLPDADLVEHVCDISDLDRVREFVAALAGSTTGLHGLIHGAGLIPPKRAVSAQGHESALATHVVGPFLLTALLRPLMVADGSGRVVWVSSGGMYSADLSNDFEYEEGEYKGVRAYARTKRMQVVLAEQFGATFVDRADPVVHSMHPGWAATPGISDSIPTFERLIRPLLRTAEQGADTIVWLAAAPEAGSTSGHFWQDRAVRPTHFLPWQRDSTVARQALWDFCRSATGTQELLPGSPGAAEAGQRRGKPAAG